MRAARATVAAMGFLAAATAAASADSLEGLWLVEVSPPALHGTLQVQRRGEQWHARLAGREAWAAVGAEVRLAIPGLGEYRGVPASDGRSIAGFWVESGPDALGGGRQSLATPLTLAAGAGGFSGRVRPLAEPFTLYLKLFRDGDGQLRALFRNPERNARGGAAQFRATVDHDTVHFDAERRDGGALRLEAQHLRRPERLRLQWPETAHALDLHRAAPADAARYYPREPGVRYAYRAPDTAGDGWETAGAGTLGADEAALTQMVERLATTDPAAPRAALIHSLLVAYRGRLILEEYFFGYERERPHDLRSAGKTFAAVLLGTAQRQGLALDAETPVYPLLDRIGPFASPEPRKAKIRLKHLLTHTSGLACDDNDDDSPGNEDAMQAQAREPNWWKYALDLPLVNEPGRRYAYCSAGMNLVGAAVTVATGEWLPRWFERTVARPLDFGRYYWNLMPNGEGYLGGGAYLRPRDLLKIGELYLDGGMWRGRHLIDASWIDASISPQQPITPDSTGLDPARFGDFYVAAVDGYAWHLGMLEVGGRQYREYAAIGNGGQILSVVPELALAVVVTAGNYGQGGVWIPFRDAIVGRQIIPALRR